MSNKNNWRKKQMLKKLQSKNKEEHNEEHNEDQTNDQTNEDQTNEDQTNEDIITKPKRGRPRIEIRLADNPEYFNQYFKSHKRKLLDRQHVYKEKKKQHDKDRDTVKLIDDLNNKVKKWISFKNREFYGIAQNENGLYETRKAVLVSQ